MPRVIRVVVCAQANGESTSGASPGFSRRLRRQLQEQFGPEYEIYLQMLARLREELKKRVHGQERRQAILESFLDSSALACLAKGAVDEAERLVEECLAGLPEGVPGE